MVYYVEALRRAAYSAVCYENYFWSHARIVERVFARKRMLFVIQMYIMHQISAIH